MLTDDPRAASTSGRPGATGADRHTGLSLFDEACAGDPEAPAIHYGTRTRRWADVDEASGKFAGWLVRQGVQPGDRVALWLQNVPEFVEALVGAWRAGAIVVPCNPMLRRKEIVHQLVDSGARVLVAEPGLLPELPAEAVEPAGLEWIVTVAVEEPETFTDVAPGATGGFGGPGSTGSVEGTGAMAARAADSVSGAAAAGRAQHGLTVASFADVLVGNPTLPPVIPPGPDDPAYLVYTSGTTGSPKAAVNTHGNVAHNAEVYRTWMALGPGDVVLGGAPLFHVTGLLAGIAASHAAAVPLVLFYRFRAEACLAMIERWRATFTVIPSTAIRALLDSPDIVTRDISTLTKLYSGGAPIPAPLAAEWQATTGTMLHSIYGLTETTSPTHAAPLGERVRADEASGLLSVGIPVPGAESRVVDEEGHDVADGEHGELWVRGPMVVPRYWERPDATATAFVDGFLRTGDVGWRDRAGYYYVVDRIKDMINASGFKVWPREVEDTLLGHPAVAEAAVVGVPDPYRGETVKAFVRLRDGHRATPDDIIAWAREHIAAYKYPRQVDVVGELPKTASGKVLRRVLRQDPDEEDPVP